jgi:branched-chain amino acid transport system permease protein
MRLAHSTIYWAGFAAILVLLVVAPLVLPEFWRRFLTEILIWGLLAMSSDLLVGYTGMVSFGHSAFFGLGMYGAAAALISTRPPSLWLALPYGLVAAAAVAAFVAYFSTRVRDIYFAITTLIFSQIFYVIIFTWTEVTGGENGVQPAAARYSRAFLRSIYIHDIALVCARSRDTFLSRATTHHAVALWNGAAIDPRERGAHSGNRLPDRTL